ncbi:hypothetical protein [Flavobacterium sp. KJJ]|uniref:hypothetical protein n=1 Tax=Flavobacterium sp. KJJ TaxID=1270193 RepID=UPI000493B300|nr:hypothetical protein [Flavobacterium sp. KJJ]
MKYLILKFKIVSHIYIITVCLIFLSCNSEEQQDKNKIRYLDQLKSELNLRNFSRVNISENIVVNWENVTKTKKENFEISEIAVNEKIASKLQSKLLQEHLKYQIVTIECEGQFYSYFLEVYGDKNSPVYPESITKLNNFTGTLNVFSLTGENLGSLGILKGQTRNISKIDKLDVLSRAIKLFSNNLSLTNKIPPCNTPYFQTMQFTVDYYEMWEYQGKIIAFNYVRTETNTEQILMSYPCDTPPNEVALAHRTAVYNFHGNSSGEAAVANTVITDPSFLNDTCLAGLYLKLGGSPIFQSYLKEFDNDFSIADLQLAGTVTLPITENARTYAPYGGVIKIVFNKNNLKRPALDIAKTFMHEMLHAEMYRQLLSLANSNGSIDKNALTQMLAEPGCPRLLDYYEQYSFNTMQHPNMAENYRETIVSFLKAFDNTLTDEQYEAIAWQGLNGTKEWSSMSTADKVRIQATYDTWITTASKNCN